MSIKISVKAVGTKLLYSRLQKKGKYLSCYKCHNIHITSPELFENHWCSDSISEVQ